MKLRVLAAIGLAAGAVWAAAQVRHEVSVVNVTVPVRVFEGERFVDRLRLEDFEVLEDGEPRPVEAVYLVRGADVRRRGGEAGLPAPTSGRSFVLIFQMTEFLTEIDDVLDHFFERVYRPGDAADIVTPRKSYRLRGAIDSPEALRRALWSIKSRVRNDLLLHHGTIRRILDEMVIHLGGGDPETDEIDLIAYEMDLERLETEHTVDKKRLTAFAAELKKRPGAKHVYVFFQRLQVPQFDNRRLMSLLSSASSEQVLKIMELVSSAGHEVRVDREAIRRTFSDASADVHFLYVTRNRRDPKLDVSRQAFLEGIQMAERSGSLYEAFRDIAAATGGTLRVSADPLVLLRQAASDSENYYLLYFRPGGHGADGKFHRITVKVRPPGLRVTHREGYFALPAADEMGAGDLAVGEGQRAERAGAAEAAAGGLAGLQEAEAISGIEDIDLIARPPAKGAPAPEPILRAVEDYCRRLKDASLDFVSREEVRERLAADIAPQGEISADASPAGRGATSRSRADLVRRWVYDYQLVRRGGRAEERRVLLEENGRPKKEDSAALRTVRFAHAFVVLGPVGLFGPEAQAIHDYRTVDDVIMEGEPVLVIDVRPSGESPGSLYGRAWVRERDGAVLKVEWEPASMGNYEEIERFAKAHLAQPRIRFSSEYAFEKNGLRFPSAYEVVEAYRMAGRTVVLSRTSVAYKDYKFFEVAVDTSIKRSP